MKRILSILAALPFSLAAFAQTEAFTWMLSEKSPAAAAMAGVSSVSPSDIAYSAFHNAAAIPFSKDRGGVAASYYFDPGLAARGSIGAGAGFRVGKRVGLAVAANYNLGVSYEQMDDNGNMLGTFKTSSMLYSAGIGVKVIDMLSLGVNLKYASERLQPEDNPWAFASDIYALFRWKGLGVSAGVVNLGTKVKDANGLAFPLPSSARIGAGYADDVASGHFVEADLDLDCYFSGAFSAALGAQYGWNDMLFVRAGYRYATKTCALPSAVSAGAGLRFFGVKLDLSYVYVPVSKANGIVVGVGYAF